MNNQSLSTDIHKDKLGGILVLGFIKLYKFLIVYNKYTASAELVLTRDIISDPVMFLYNILLCMPNTLLTKNILR